MTVFKLSFSFSLLIFLVLTGCQGVPQDLATLPDNRIPVTGPGLLVSREGLAAIESVISAEPGWACVQADLLGQPGDVLGCAAVPAGERSNVAISLDARRLTSQVHLVLYRDAGTVGELEVPDPDAPVLTTLGRQVSTEVRLLGDPAWIRVADQPLAQDQSVTVDSVYSPVPALLVIHDARDKRVLGYSPVQRGENLSVRVVLEVRGEPHELMAELHWDVNNVGELNLTDPASEYTDGEYVAVPFQLTSTE